MVGRSTQISHTGWGEQHQSAKKLTSVIIRHYESCTFDIYLQKFKHLAKMKKKNTVIKRFPYYMKSIEATNANDINWLFNVFKWWHTLSKRQLELIHRGGLEYKAATSLLNAKYDDD